MSVSLKDLRKTLAVKNAERKALILKGDTAEPMSDEDNDAADNLDKIINGIKLRITRLVALAADDADTAEEPQESDDGDEEASKKAYKPTGVLIQHARPANEAKGTRFVRFLMGAAIAHKNKSNQAGINFIDKNFNDKDVTKALAATTTAAVGGALIPQDFRAELIDLLYAQSVVRSSGVQIIPMPMGNLTIPKLDGGATSYWQGELDDMQVSQQAFTDLQFRAHKLTTLVPVSNDLIRYSPLTVEAIVRNDMVRQMALKEDLAFLLGTGAASGTGFTPVGLAGIAGTTPLVGGAATLAGVVGTLRSAELSLMANNVSTKNAQWYFSPQALTFINTLTDSTGRFFFADETARGTLLGYKFNVSNQIPSNVGTGATGSTIFFVNVDDLMILDTLSVFADSSSEATYSGNQSAYTRDQTVFRTIEEVDFGTRHPLSICVITTTDWLPGGSAGSPGAAYVADSVNTTNSAAGSTHA